MRPMFWVPRRCSVKRRSQDDRRYGACRREAHLVIGRGHCLPVASQKTTTAM